MRATEFVAESLDRAYEWEPRLDGGMFRAADGEIVRVQFDVMGVARHDVWAVSFNRGVNYDLTGTGDEFRVFATVAAIIRDWVRRNRPSVLTFSADKSDGNRVRLYQRLINRLIQNSGYVDVSRNADVITDSGARFATQTILYKLNTPDHSVFALARQDLVADPEPVQESWGPERYPIPLPIGDYLSHEQHEFAPPGDYRDVSILHREVGQMINQGVQPHTVPVDPRQLLATQDWLSNEGGGEPLFPEYADRPVVYEKQGKAYILDGHHRTTRAQRLNRPISVYLFTDETDDEYDDEESVNEDAYDVLHSHQCGPFDGGCVMVAQALQQIHGGDIVVLVDSNDQAQHAAVAVDGQLMDYSGAAPIRQFVDRFQRNERVKISGVRPIRPQDLPEAPRDRNTVTQLVQVLGENFADGRKPGRRGLAKRMGVDCKQSVSKLRSIAKKSSGERQRMANWCANMKSGKRK